MKTQDFFTVLWYNKDMKNIKKTTEMVSISREEYEEFKRLKEQETDLKQQIKWLMEQSRLAKSKKFGFSSEKEKAEMIEQLSMLCNEAELTVDIEEEQKEEVTTEVAKHTRKKRSKELREHLPEDVPTEVALHGLSEAERICAVCGHILALVGKETRETLVIVPARVYIRRDIYYNYACRNCQETGIKTPFLKTPKDKPVIAGSFASPEAVAHLMTQKFVMGSPLYRQSAEFQSAGIELSRQTMSNWVLKASEQWLTPIYKALHEELLARQVLHADETPLQVLHSPGKAPTSKSYMWLYRTSGDTEKAIVLYEYQPTRAAQHPKSFLKDFSGYLHVDGYSAYHTLPEQIQVVGCFAHARRKFDEAIKALPKGEQKNCAAQKGFSFCQKLFKIEEQLAKLPPQKRKEERQKRAKPVLDAFLAWAKSRNAAPKSTLGAALLYLENQWPYLIKYLEDGRLELSNNRAERSIKPFVMSRKNFLFANTPSGATGSATMFSLIETAKENGLDPFRYLTYVFQTAPNMDLKQAENIQQLLPWNAPEICKSKIAKRKN